MPAHSAGDCKDNHKVSILKSMANMTFEKITLMTYISDNFFSSQTSLLISHFFLDGYFFSNCGYPSGPLGPQDEDCKEHYKETSVSVKIGDASKEYNENHVMGFATGIQRWQVPKTSLYT